MLSVPIKNKKKKSKETKADNCTKFQIALLTDLI